MVPAPPGMEGEARPRRVDDLQLLAQCRAGDPESAGALYDRARPIVSRTITRLLGARDPDRQDLAQLAMIELTASIDRYRGDCAFDAWAATITAHLVYKHIRRRRIERKALTEQLASPDESATSAPTRELLLRSLCASVVRHLEQLPPRNAWAVVLHHLHGYGMQEIATIMGSSVAAAQVRVSRGRRELHQRVVGDPELAGALDLLEEEAP